MSDLIERLRFLGDRRREELIRAGNKPSEITGDWIVEHQAADEIERLEDARKFYKASYLELEASNAKLQAVVDVVKVYFDEGGSYKRADAIDALAALEREKEVD